MISSIIFEGPDMCGKTHIARALASILHIPYFKNAREREVFGSEDTRYFATASQYVDTYMVSFLRDTQTHVIFDRNYPSQFVYPRVFGRDHDLDLLRRIDDAHAELGTRIVIPVRSTYHDLHDDVHDCIIPTTLELLDAGYRDFVKWTKCRTLLLNVDDEDIDRELADILAWLSS